MTGRRIASALVVAGCYAAGCYTPSPARRERTTVADDAKAVLAQVIAPKHPARIDHDGFERHYSAAMDSYHRAEYPRAIAEFEAAFAIDPQPLLIFNIAQAYRKAGRLDDALRSYRDYLQRDPSAERGHVTELIDQVEQELARKPTAKEAP